jgi:serine/threonine protein kinase
MTNTKPSFEIVRTLGIGGIATVYLARRDEGGTSQNVALKKPHAFLTEDPATFAILEDEAKLAACIRHPNVVGVLDFVGGDEPALVMEWIDGVELGKLARAASDTGRRLPVDVVAAIARDVLAGLHAAHESRDEDGVALDIVHRNVSPQNVLVGFDGSARITDFGVAKATSRQQHTEDGSIKGKLRYLAPEQLTSRCDRRTDVFAVGAVMWELLTGMRMRAGDGVELLVEILCAQTRAPSAVAADAACLDAVVMGALQRAPEDRFATAASMLEAIEAATPIASAARVSEVVRETMLVAETPQTEVSAPWEQLEELEELAALDLLEETAQDIGAACVTAARITMRMERELGRPAAARALAARALAPWWQRERSRSGAMAIASASPRGGLRHGEGRPLPGSHDATREVFAVLRSA